MTPAQVQLARRRLALGITNVGFWVLTAAGGLLWLLLHATGTVNPLQLGLLLAGAVVIQAGFDLVGGFWLMPTPEPTAVEFLCRWLRGVAAHTLVVAGVGWLSYVSFRLSGGFALAILVATAGLVVARRWLLHVIGGVVVTSAPHLGVGTLVAQVADPAFTGGIVGVGSRSCNLLPASWSRDLPPAELAAELSRRLWQQATGLPGRTVLSILAWNLLGAVVGAFAFGVSHRPPGTALLIHACWMTLWTFGSLLILPSLSRGAVFAADRAARVVGHDPRNWIAHFPALVGEDGGSGPLVQTIFYPVPSARRRLEAMQTPSVSGYLFGNLARSNLYYSWACCTLLGRAVHCNVGRPALWVFPPSA